MDLMQMSPRRPYLLRAFYDWLIDNKLTPHIVVDAFYYGIQVPMEYVNNGQIILNIAPHAVGHLELTNKEVRFNARFGGIPHQVYIPMGAILAIYARENGAGTMFEPEPVYEEQMSTIESAEELETPKAPVQLVEQDVDRLVTTSDNPDLSSERKKPSLKIVK